MNNIFILTSSFYICDEEHNMFHKLAFMLNQQDCIIFSNSSCKYIDWVVTNDEHIIKFLNIIEYVFILFTTYPQSPTDSKEDFINCEYPLNLLLQIDNQENLKSKLVFIDYFERSWNNKVLYNGFNLREEPFTHRFLSEYSKHVFKRECYPDLSFLPFPEPIFDEKINKAVLEKTYDVFCSFPQQFTGLRKECIKVCEQLLSENYNILIKHDCNPDDYDYYVSHSKITVDAYGAGQVNHRFLNIIANRSVCCRQKYTINFYKDYDDSMIIEYETAEELFEKLKKYLCDSDLLEKMEMKAYRHYLTYHTSKKVGKYILEKIKS
jgi:hypothetical protein